jgi:hypothetical protein
VNKVIISHKIKTHTSCLSVFYSYQKSCFPYLLQKIPRGMAINKQTMQTDATIAETVK